MSYKDIYEKAELFYLGKDVDENFHVTDALTLVKNKNFTTHAAIIGMTGSGKTGLGIALLEEASIDNIPSIIIDPKGDMGDLLLTDPDFSIDKFKKWVQEDALTKGENLELFAEKTADTWKKGIESFYQDSERVKKFQQVDKTIYTPGSSVGVGINILSFLKKPSQELINDIDSFTSYLSSTVSSLLSLIGLDNDTSDAEYVFLSQIIKNEWLKNRDLTIESLIGMIINPQFKKIGVIPLESFFPKKERLKLANSLNSVIASPDFEAWLFGDDLDIQKILYDKNGNAKVSIFSISHLDERKRMFFVTFLLNKIVAWMRMQPGSGLLKTILYMDEIYGYFPPVKNPPSKEPLMILLKQARAFGLGVVLSTQNPGDIDYKGLSNIGTWFVGRLQTERDIEKVVDSLSSKIGTGYSKKEIMNLLRDMKKRTFLLKSVHDDGIRLFTTRWVLSYLKGPLNKKEISELMKNKKIKFNVQNEENNKEPLFENFVKNNPISDVLQRYDVLPGVKRYIPTILAEVSVHFSDARRGIEYQKTDILNLVPSITCNWSEAGTIEDKSIYSLQPPSDIYYALLPECIKKDNKLKNCKTLLKNYIYINEKLTIYRCRKLKIESKIDENYEDFVLRVKNLLRQNKDEEIEKIKERYQKQIERLNKRLKDAHSRLEKEKADKTSSIINAGISLISALFGGKSVSRIGSTVSKGSRVLKEGSDVKRAEEKIEEIKNSIFKIEQELEDKIYKIDEKYNIDNYDIEEIFIKPKKSLINIEEISILWKPVN